MFCNFSLKLNMANRRHMEWQRRRDGVKREYSSYLNLVAADESDSSRSTYLISQNSLFFVSFSRSFQIFFEAPRFNNEPTLATTKSRQNTDCFSVQCLIL